MLDFYGFLWYHVAMKTIKTASLEFREGSSDKEYHLTLQEHDGMCDVAAAWGRRGSTLQTGFKASGVTLAEAEKAYDKVLKEKTGKGYKPMGGEQPVGLGTSVTAIVTARDQRDTGLRPQLLNPITEEEAEAYLIDNDWCAQEKFNGKRMQIRKTLDAIVAANKKGLSIGFPDAIARALKTIDASFVVDGEAIGEVLNAFDLLEQDGMDFRDKPYRVRLAQLHLLVWSDQKAVVVAPTAIGTEAKRKLMADLKAAGKEGIVFKKLSAKWYAGRPASGGSAIKCKFWASISCVVSKVNARRSIEVSLEGKPVGNVTISPNWAVPKAGQVVEIRYLYVVGAGGKLYQPIYLGPRDAVDASECTFEQQKIKYKPEED